MLFHSKAECTGCNSIKTSFLVRCRLKLFSSIKICLHGQSLVERWNDILKLISNNVYFVQL